jgi:membrane-anchored protein YejM (alkaline phosphatase superfamily)
LPDGSSWDTHRETVADLMIATVDSYAPNFKRSVLARQILTPHEVRTLVTQPRTSLEMDSNVGRIMDGIRADAPNTIVIFTADNGAWQDAWPDVGTHPFRGEKGSPFEAGWRVPGIMWWAGHIPAGAQYGEMMSHIDCWATLAAMVGITPPPHGAWVGNDGKPIYFDSIDNNAYVLGKAKDSARTWWVYKW